MSKKNKNCCSRRHFLAMTGAAGLVSTTDPFEILLRSLVDGLISKAQAAETGQEVGNLIDIHLDGAPTDWMIKSKNPRGQGNFINNEQLKTAFTAGGVTASTREHRVSPLNVNGITYHLPPLWHSQLPLSGGGSIAASQLWKHCLQTHNTMQGDGHLVNQVRWMKPSDGDTSLSGRVADLSSRAIPAVAMEPTRKDSYKSSRVSQVLTSGGAQNPLINVLAPFDRPANELPGEFLNRRQAMDVAVMRALNLLRIAAASKNPGTENLFALRHTAEQTIRTGVSGVLNTYPALKAKYEGIIDRCVQAAQGVSNPVAGVGDRAISPSANREMILIGEPVTYVNMNGADVRTIFRTQAQAGAAATTLEYMAKGCALAESLIVNGFSNFVMFSEFSARNLYYPETRRYADNSLVGTNVVANYGLDQHNEGGLLSLVVNTFIHHALISCVYELMDCIRRAGQWENTVIMTQGEFGRSPRQADVMGSDHGWEGAGSTLFSGKLSRPFILGNLTSNTNGQYIGTWKGSSLNLVDGGRYPLRVEHVASTVAHLVGINTPTPNSQSLLLNGQQLVEDSKIE